MGLMLRGLATSASGMLTDERYQQLLANNLANVETPGFKASSGEMLSFPEQLIMMTKGGAPASPVLGELGTGTLFQEGVPMFVQGTLSQTNRNLDVAIVDNTPQGTYAAVASGQPAAAGANPGAPNAVTNAATTNPVNSVAGQVTAGPGGRLQVHGRDAAVVDSTGQAVQNVFAMKNPKYQGTTLYTGTGQADYDANGNPSYLFVNGAGQVVGTPGEISSEGWSLRTGQSDTMGYHSFYPVEYTSDNGQKGIVLTHDGHLDVNAQHELVDASGNPILPIQPGTSSAPQIVFGGRIVLNPAYQGKDLFGPDGNPLQDAKGNWSYQAIDANGRVIPGGKLNTVDADITNVTPLGQTEFMVGGTLNNNAIVPMLRVGTGSMKPGQLENSTADPTFTMTQMLNIVNQYQANQQMIQEEDGLLNKAVNDVGKVNA
jgi:flagellar hook protein FlgE